MVAVIETEKGAGILHKTLRYLKRNQHQPTTLLEIPRCELPPPLVRAAQVGNYYSLVCQGGSFTLEMDQNWGLAVAGASVTFSTPTTVKILNPASTPLPVPNAGLEPTFLLGGVHTVNGDGFLKTRDEGRGENVPNLVSDFPDVRGK